MNLAPIDIVIIAVYVALIITIGFVVKRKAAAQIHKAG